MVEPGRPNVESGPATISMPLREQTGTMGFFERLNSIYRNWRGEENHRSPGSTFQVTSGLHTSIGYFRDNNEDRVVVDDETMIYVVADGMGGQAAGEQASQMAVDIVPQELRERLVEADEPNKVREAIKLAVFKANQSIVERGDNDPSTQNMGTTIVLGVCRAGKMYVAHIGDSRAYLIRDGQIKRMTTDHNLAQALFEANTISAEELDTHRFRHVLWKYLGSKEFGDGPDISEIKLQDGDRILLATDGLTGSLTDEMIRDEILKATDPAACSAKLVSLALDNGSRDNVTGAVLFVAGPSQSATDQADVAEQTTPDS
jgi:protein phosphatase